MKQENPSILSGLKPSSAAILLGALFSLFLVVGRSFRLRTDFSLITEAPWKAGIIFILLWLLFAFLLTLLYRWMDSLGAGRPAEISSPNVKDFRHPVLTRMLLLLAMWSILQIWFLPGNIPSDPWHQLGMVLGYSGWNTHHPLFATLTMGAIYRFGMMIGGQNLGTFLCVLLQDLLGSFAFASMITYVRNRSRSRVLGIVCMLFMGFLPVFPAYMFSLGKDAFYLSYLTFFLLSYVRIMLKDERKYTRLFLVVFGALASMQRHDGLYLIVPTLFILIFLVEGKKNRRQIFLAFALVVLVAFSEKLFISRVLDLHSDRQTEALSIPLQQIGRYVVKHGDELTEEEIEIIDAVIQYDGIPERYDPQHSNGIKNYSRNTATKDDWIRFFKLWADKLADDPLTYIEATMNSVFGYTDPAYNRGETLGLYQAKASKGGRLYSSYIFPKACRKAVTAYREFLYSYFPFRVIMASATYYWIYLILLGAVLRKKKNRKHALFFVFPLLVFAICVASPICGSLRYSMPAITALPLFLYVTLRSYRQDPDT